VLCQLNEGLDWGWLQGKPETTKLPQQTTRAQANFIFILLQVLNRVVLVTGSASRTHIYRSGPAYKPGITLIRLFISIEILYPTSAGVGLNQTGGRKNCVRDEIFITGKIPEPPLDKRYCESSVCASEDISMLHLRRLSRYMTAESKNGIGNCRN
jgi:hypothetical protein